MTSLTRVNLRRVAAAVAIVWAGLVGAQTPPVDDDDDGFTIAPIIQALQNETVRPNVSVAFEPALVVEAQPTWFTVRVTNPAVLAPMRNVRFSQTLPTSANGAVVIFESSPEAGVSPATCTGTLETITKNQFGQSALPHVFKLTGGVIPPQTTCTYRVRVAAGIIGGGNPQPTWPVQGFTVLADNAVTTIAPTASITATASIAYTVTLTMSPGPYIAGQPIKLVATANAAAGTVKSMTFVYGGVTLTGETGTGLTRTVTVPNPQRGKLPSIIVYVDATAGLSSAYISDLGAYINEFNAALYVDQYYLFDGKLTVALRLRIDHPDWSSLNSSVRLCQGQLGGDCTLFPNPVAYGFQSDDTFTKELIGSVILLPGPQSLYVVIGDPANPRAITNAVVVTGPAVNTTPTAPTPVAGDTPHVTNPDAGTLPGSLSVSKDGAATYSVPIDVPPGTAGLKPNLSLNYTSQGTNGLLGLGWSLGGMSSIHRCGKTIAQDNINERISFSPTDRLCLDGQRLVLVNGTGPNDDASYWSNSAEYRIEIDSFSRIRAQGTSLATRSFKVEAKDGRIMTYGDATVSSTSVVQAVVLPVQNGVGGIQPTAKGAPLSWAISNIRDRANNFVKFDYEQSTTTGEHRPSVVRYGGNGLSAHAAVQFTYESRDDAWTRYVDEARNDLRSRIAKITTYVGTNLDTSLASATKVRDYKLTYEKSPTSGRSLFNSVEACARNPQSGADECLPKTNFDWGKPDANKSLGFVSRGTWGGGPILTTTSNLSGTTVAALHPDYFAILDFSNDGRADILEKRVASPSRSYLEDAYTSIYRDANSIVAGTLSDRYRYFHNNGAGFTQYLYKIRTDGISTDEKFAVLATGDFNGDGSSDLVVFTESQVAKICVSPLGQSALPANPTTPITFNCGSKLTGLGPNNTQIDMPFRNDVGSLPFVVDVFGNGISSIYSQFDENLTDPTTGFMGAAWHCRATSQSSGAAIAPAMTCVPDSGISAGIVGRADNQQAYIEDNPQDWAYNHVSFQQMVDFAGTGKANDARWTVPYLTRYAGDTGTNLLAGFSAEDLRDFPLLTLGSTRLPAYRWANLQPIVKVTDFVVPGAKTSGAIRDYKYPAYNVSNYISVTPQPNTSSVAPNKGGTPYKFDKPSKSAGVAVDFNGSGYSGLVFGFIELRNTVGVGPSYNENKTELTVCNSAGRSLDCRVRKKYSGREYRRVDAVGQFSGDGHPTIVMEKLSFPANGAYPISTGLVEMCRIAGDDTTGGAGNNDNNMLCEATTSPTWLFRGRNAVSANATSPRDVALYADVLGTGRMQIVFYRGGALVNGAWVEEGVWEIFEPLDRAITGQALDRIHRVTNGVGHVSSVEYVDGVASGTVTRSTGSTNYPVQPTSGVGKIVKRLSVGNGVSSPRSVRYDYKDQANDISGRGSLGFREVISTDEQSSIVTTNTYFQEFPLTGMMQSSVVKYGAVEISNTQSRYSVKEIAQANGAKTLFPFMAGSTATMKDLDGSAKGSVVTSGDATADVQYDNWGNMISSKVVASGSGADANYSSTTRTTNTFLAADTVNWLVGLVDRSSVTKQHTTDATAITRVVAYTYEPNFTGRVQTETVQPDDGTLTQKVATTYSYNGFGMAISKATTWRNLFTGADETASDKTTYDANGRYPATRQNALNHSEAHGYDAGTGARASLTGPNNLTTTWTNDGFGRVNVEKRADGNETRQYRKRCTAGCPTGAVTAEITESFNGASRVSPPVVVYRDDAGRVLRTRTSGFDGTIIFADQRYDSRGRLAETDHPRFETATAPAETASRQLYDDLDRVTTASVFDENGTHNTTSVYAGFNVTMTNPKGQVRVDTSDATGKVVKVKDANDGITQFSYDAFGNLTQTIDPSGNVIKVEYDTLGRKKRLTDPNLGIIDYNVDARGLVWNQVSPNQRTDGKSTRTEYDKLGRMTARIEPDLDSRWVYDTANKGIGQLAEATGAPTSDIRHYRRSHAYDNLARPTITSETLADSNTYISKTDYDGVGRIGTQTYSNTYGKATPKVYQSRYNAQGYLADIVSGNTVLWSITQQDASLRNKQIRYGNGLIETLLYDTKANRLKSATLATAGGANRLSEAYQYDSLANVTQRVQNYDVGGFTESFTYDNLNRIKTSTIGQATQNFTYSATGNIETKSGGTYTYPAQGANAVRPHAVLTVSGIAGITSGAAFGYDANGNLISIPGTLTANWTSFDMPARITRTNSGSGSFMYGPEHQRIRQDKHDGSSTNYAGAQEVEFSNTGALTIKTYMPHGIGVEIDRAASGAATATTEVNYVHQDRLGSPVAITDAVGNVKERMAYDAWGKRRTVDGAATPNNLDGITDNRGFTGHEMLDHLDLVHMNGRVYEPLLGRFLSADPILQDPMNGQSYNRYAYVLNNPTNLTDPTGFSPEGIPGCSVNNGQCQSQAIAQAIQQQQLAPIGDKAKATTKKDGKGNTQGNAKGGGDRGATIGPVHDQPTLLQSTVENMKIQGGFGLLGAYVLEGASKFAGTTGITTNQGEPYDYVANSMGCRSATCKDEARTNVILTLTGFIGRPGQAANAARTEAAAANLSKPATVGTVKDVDIAAGITKPYQRPSGATTQAQRNSVQGHPCVDCGKTTSRQFADHKEPLVKEYYRTGTIDINRMRRLDSVQSQCPGCSNRQGGELSQLSKEIKKYLGL
jgi:RHS repeat-associated protein